VQYCGISPPARRARRNTSNSKALSRTAPFVRHDGAPRGAASPTAIAETKDLIAGWMVITSRSYDRAPSWAVVTRPRLRFRRGIDPEWRGLASMPGRVRDHHGVAHGEDISGASPPR